MIAWPVSDPSMLLDRAPTVVYVCVYGDAYTRVGRAGCERDGVCAR